MPEAMISKAKIKSLLESTGKQTRSTTARDIGLREYVLKSFISLL